MKSACPSFIANRIRLRKSLWPKKQKKPAPPKRLETMGIHPVDFVRSRGTFMLGGETRRLRRQLQFGFAAHGHFSLIRFIFLVFFQKPIALGHYAAIFNAPFGPHRGTDSITRRAD